MNINHIEEILDKIVAASEFYDQLAASDIKTAEDLETVQIKMRYSKEQVLKLTLELKKEIDKAATKLAGE
jgi:hypothetical protein